MKSEINVVSAHERFIIEPQALQLMSVAGSSSGVLTGTFSRSTSWTSRGCRRRARGAAARGTRRRRAAAARTASRAAAPPTRPCDSTAWAGAARAMRAGPGSASSCFKKHVLKQHSSPTSAGLALECLMIDTVFATLASLISVHQIFETRIIN